MFDDRTAIILIVGFYFIGIIGGILLGKALGL